MITPSQLRDLARLLISLEGPSNNASAPEDSATLRAYETLRNTLGAFAGTAAFRSLASRALVLARPQAPSLSLVQITANGTLNGMGESLRKFQHQIKLDEGSTAEDPTTEAGVILIAQLLGLLLIFLGEALTLSLLRTAWPGTSFDSSNSENGRKP
jgi:hypothetical protein